MLLAPVPFHLGFTTEPFLGLTNPMSQHAERRLILVTDDTPESQTQAWESLWIDLGGEG
jgi:hypothetical protein